MLRKPDHIFGREGDWRSLAQFAGRRTPGATLGLVYGRRRQGKTLLLESLTESQGGFYYMALEQEESLALRELGEVLGTYLGTPGPIVLGDWNQAVDALLDLGNKRTVPVVLDEFPYLVDAAPQLPSVVQRAFGPRASKRASSRSRLILCGSALSVMSRLLSVRAALRGRASLDLLVQPFDFRESADFWGMGEHHRLAFLLNAVVGGTPAYKELAGLDPPADERGWDAWITGTLLRPASALFREGRYLMAEEPGLEDRALYHSVLTAIAEGNTRPNQIAGILGRPQTALTHPLRVLEDIRLIRREDDALRSRRPTYHIAEPILRFHHALMRRNLTRLELGAAKDVWEDVRTTFSSRILGPHFEDLARLWTQGYASPSTLGGRIGNVGRTVVHDPRRRSQVEIDVVALSSTGRSNRPRVRAIGEAKWQKGRMDERELERLISARSLLELQGVADPRKTRLLLFCPSGFTRELQQRARQGEVELVDFSRLYRGE